MIGTAATFPLLRTAYMRTYHSLVPLRLPSSLTIITFKTSCIPKEGKLDVVDIQIECRGTLPPVLLIVLNFWCATKNATVTTWLDRECRRRPRICNTTKT